MKIEELLKVIIKTLDDKKANDIKILKVSPLTILGDYFVVCDSNNVTHVKSLVGEIEEKTKEIGCTPKRIEKDKQNTWIALDYSDIIVHIFLKSAREFYNIERIWADAIEISVDDILK